MKSCEIFFSSLISATKSKSPVLYTNGARASLHPKVYDLILALVNSVLELLPQSGPITGFWFCL